MENELKHYGVLGMKWGHRKDGRPQGYQGTGMTRGEVRKARKAYDQQREQDWKNAKVKAKEVTKGKSVRTKLEYRAENPDYTKARANHANLRNEKWNLTGGERNKLYARTQVKKSDYDEEFGNAYGRSQLKLVVGAPAAAFATTLAVRAGATAMRKGRLNKALRLPASRILK